MLRRRPIAVSPRRQHDAALANWTSAASPFLLDAKRADGLLTLKG
jgi:hypothetical protein